MLKENDNLANLEDVFKALANKHRLEALSLLLREGEASLQSLSKKLHMPLKTASRNLTILKKAGFLSARTENGRVIYEINTSSVESYVFPLLVLVKDATSPTRKI